MRTRTKWEFVVKAAAPGARVPRAERFVPMDSERLCRELSEISF